MNGITELKETLKSRILSQYGLNSDRYDSTLEDFIKKNNIDISNPKFYGVSDDLNIPSDESWLIAAVHAIINSVIPEEAYNIFYGPGRSFVKISIQDDIRYYRLSVSLMSKESCIRGLDPIWVYNNHDLIKKFLSEDYEPYKRAKELCDKINKTYIII